MGVKSLGYVVVATAQPDRWHHFLTRVAGAMRGADAADGAAQYRIDDRPFRLRIELGGEERFIAAGYEVGEAEFERLLSALPVAGRPLEVGTSDQAALRGVARLLRTSDPAGANLEFFCGDTRDAVAFVSPVGVPGFVTGTMGMGHAVFSAPNFAEVHGFYRDVIGFHDTDLPEFHLMGPDAPPMRFAFMHADNGRHHSIALGEGPQDEVAQVAVLRTFQEAVVQHPVIVVHL